MGGLPACRYGPCEPDALRDRMLRAVASLGEAEVRSIIEEQGKVEVSVCGGGAGGAGHGPVTQARRDTWCE